RRWPRLPHVLADRRAHVDVAEAEEDEPAALREIAVLVEDAVVREILLAVYGTKRSVGADGACVGEVPVEPGGPDERDDACGLPTDLFDALACARHESRAQQEVLGRIAGHRELRKE